jgi:ribosomal protein S2
MSSLYNVLISLGVHVGHFKQSNISSHNSHLVGSRFGIDVLDIKDVVFSLRKAMHFIYQVGKIKGDLLFHISSLDDYNANIHFFFVNMIVLKYKQRFFDEQWVFGQFGNIRQHAISFIFQLFFVQRNKFNLYVSKNFKRSMGYRSNLLRKRYTRHRLSYTNSNRKYYYTSYLKKRTFNILSHRKRSSMLHNLLNTTHFYDLFLRVIFYSYFKRIKGVSFDLHFNKMIKFFKFVLVFKYFRNFLVLPDAFILTNPNKLQSPVLEMLGYKIPVIGLLDTNSDSFGITYPIYSNDDNILLSIFYFKLFLKVHSWGKMKRFLN